MAKPKQATSSQGGEIQVQKSPAEFFAENQAIAGFDNMGKSLYTSIRELVENSLDACEAIGVLPDISVVVTEYTQAQFNQQAGLGESPLKKSADSELFQKKKTSGKRKKAVTAAAAEEGLRRFATGSATETAAEETTSTTRAEEPDATATSSSSHKTTTTTKEQRNIKKRSQQDAYFRITVTDNGCGMRHDDIPNLFGRVLSGSKYGVRQTRGKFGLGAKMALIWSKKSTGQPVRIISAHRPNGGNTPPSQYSLCVLDIDIYKNAPKIIQHELIPNDSTSSSTSSPVMGTSVELLIAGSWSAYRSRIIQYIQQLAVITPYAMLELTYDNAADETGKRRLQMRYDRRSEQMPPPAQTVKHHPSSVNNLVIQQLIQHVKINSSNNHSKKKNKNMTLVQFLSTELSAVSPALAKRLVTELATTTNDRSITEMMHPTELTDQQITRLVQLLRQVQLFKAPDGSCLSPLGEYNLNLGISKVLEPNWIATARDKPGAYEGHPFLVEAAVCLGGKKEVGVLKEEGITVVRFANRIPLLFEGGADVCTRVAQTKIRWSNYKIDHKKEKVGVFVSIVSTKIPFKGTSKEYIGDDATEIQQSVKRALQSCCQQLRVHLLKRNALKDAHERRSRLFKYVPDLSRSIFGLLDGMRKRRLEQPPQQQPPPAAAAAQVVSSPWASHVVASPRKRLRLDQTAATEMIQRLNRGQVTEALIEQVLKETIEEQQRVLAGAAVGENGGVVCDGTTGSGDCRVRVPLFLVPLYNLEDAQHDVGHALFSFRPIQPVQRVAWRGSAAVSSETREETGTSE